MTNPPDHHDELDDLLAPQVGDRVEDPRMRSLIRRLGRVSPPSLDTREQQLATLLAAVREHVGAMDAAPLTWRARLSRVLAATTAKVVIASTTAAAATGGLAATGNLPRPVESVVSAAAHAMGLSLPGSDDAPLVALSQDEEPGGEPATEAATSPRGATTDDSSRLESSVEATEAAPSPSPPASPSPSPTASPSPSGGLVVTIEDPAGEPEVCDPQQEPAPSNPDGDDPSEEPSSDESPSPDSSEPDDGSTEDGSASEDGSEGSTDDGDPLKSATRPSEEPSPSESESESEESSTECTSTDLDEEGEGEGEEEAEPEPSPSASDGDESGASPAPSRSARGRSDDAPGTND